MFRAADEKSLSSVFCCRDKDECVDLFIILSVCVLNVWAEAADEHLIKPSLYLLSHVVTSLLSCD